MLKSVRKILLLRTRASDHLTSSGQWNMAQFLRCSSGTQEKKAESLKEIPEEISFNSFLQQREEQARRSVVIQISELRQWENVVQVCSDIGKINQVLHYEVDKSNFLIVEMNSEEDLHNLLNCHQNELQRFCNYKHFLRFNNNMKKRKENFNPPADINKIQFKVQTKVNLEHVLKKELKRNLSLSSHIQELYNALKINDLGIRIRFLTCLQIKHLLSGLFVNCFVYPFGSSVSNFGINGCDLDVVLLLENINQNSSYHLKNSESVNTERSVLQSHLVVISDLFKNFLSDSKNFLCIKNATVPITKFKQALFGLECDFTLYNPHGILTTQMLFILSSLNNCVKPLVFILRTWAKVTGIVSKQPGQSISNFSLTLLIIFFLQQNKNYGTFILPPWNIFPKTKNILMSDKEVILTLAPHKKKLQQNRVSLEEYLFLFYDFYSKFDFKQFGISLKTGKVKLNSNNVPLYIENPLLPELNVTKNVSNVEVLKFQNYCIVASEILKDNNISDSSKFAEIFYLNNYKVDWKKQINSSRIKISNIFDEI